jgi:hypothetical protein
VSLAFQGKIESTNQNFFMSYDAKFTGLVSVKSYYNTYLSSMPDKSVVQQKVCGDFEKYEPVYSEDGKLALRTCHGTFLYATKDGSIRQTAGLSNDCYFVQVPIKDSKFSFKTSHGTFVYGLKDGSWTHGISSTDPWAQFDIEVSQNDNFWTTDRLELITRFKDRVVAIKTSDGDYISALENGKMSLVSHCDEQEWFKVVEVNGKLAFKTYYDTYLCAMNDETMSQQKNSEEWEYFTLEKAKYGKFNIKTAFSTYVSALKNGTLSQQKNANAEEEFDIKLISKGRQVSIRPGKKVSLKSHHGTFICATKDGLLCQEIHPGDFTRFTLHNSGENWSFETYFGTYVTACMDKDKFAQKGNDKNYLEQFRIVLLGDGRYALQTVHGTFLSANKDGSISQSAKCKDWESFTFQP